MPNVIKKKPAMRKMLWGSRKGRRWSIFFDAWCLAFTLGLTVKLAMMRRKRMRNAEIRIVQGKPTDLIKCVSMMGKMTPPKLDPVEQMPKAAARLLLKYSGNVLMAVNGFVSLML